MTATIRANWSIKRNATAGSRVVGFAEVVRPFWVFAIATNCAGAAARTMRGVYVLGLRLAQHEILNPVIGLNAIEVMDYFCGQEFAPEMRFHRESVLKKGFALFPKHYIPERVHCPEPPAPRGRRCAGRLSLLRILASLRARWSVVPELARMPSNGRLTYHAWFRNCSHDGIITQLQEV